MARATLSSYLVSTIGRAIAESYARIGEKVRVKMGKRTMNNKQLLFSMIDKLAADDLEQVYQHVKQRRQVISLHTATGTHHSIPETEEREPAESIREEVNAVIDDAITNVRRNRETQEIAQAKS